MLLSTYVATYRDEHTVCDKYFISLRSAARMLERHAGGELPLESLSSDMVNTWLLKLGESGLSPHTIHAKRRCIISLWTAAHAAGLAPPIGRIRPIKCPEIVPTGFLPEEMKAMIDVAATLRGDVGRKLPIPRCLWWGSFLRTMYDTGLRLSDVLSIEREWIWIGGFLSIVQSKTRRSHRVQLRPATLKAIEACMSAQPNRRLIWPLWCNRNRWYKQFHVIRESAGIETRKATKGIRILSASMVDKHQPGRGSRHLGHRSPHLFEKHYKDPRICGDDPTLPPEL